MNDQMTFSKSISLVKQERCLVDSYGIDNGSFVFKDNFIPGKVSFYRCALMKPERLDILAKAEAQKSTKGRRFLIWSANML